jgi:hypothetical protein
VACVAAGTPWLVVRIALHVAARHAGAVGSPFSAPPAVGQLTRVTAVVLPVVIAAALLLTPPSLLMGIIDVTVFGLMAVFGLLALGEIDAASRPAREVTAAERTASLRPRRVGDYLPLAARLVPFVITLAGLAAFFWRLSLGAPGRLLIPNSFVLAAPVFLWLYETWMRTVVSGDAGIGGSDDADTGRRRRVRQIFALEVLLVAGLISVGHALLGADWAQDTVRVALATVTGAVLGVIGCAFAVASDLNRRRYREAGSR